MIFHVIDIQNPPGGKIHFRFCSTHKTVDLIIFAIVTVAAIFAAIYSFALSQVDHIKKNWVQYRCNPMYMPVAGMVGDDVMSNFTKCTMKGFHDYAGFVMDPVMAQFSLVNDVVSEIGDTMGSMRSMFSGVRGGFLGIVGSVFGKIHNLMAQTQYTVIRMRTILSRVVGVMYSLVYIFYGGMQTGASVVNGPVGGTMRFLCFDENTKIQTFEGLKLMKDVKVGERLQSNLAIITSVYHMDGANIPMYSLHGILVSGSHKVKYKTKFISVKDHPNAKLQTTPSKRLVCFNTTSHRIKLGGHEFLDFVESDDTDFVNFKHRYIEMLYNGSGSSTKYNEMTGIVGTTPIELQTDRLIPVSNIQIGDVLRNGDVVKGVCIHSIKMPIYSTVDGVMMSPNTWVYKNGKVYKAGDIGENCYSEDSYNVYQFITESSMYPVTGPSDTTLHILDELETTEDFYHTMKDSIITTGRFRNKVIVV